MKCKQCEYYYRNPDEDWTTCHFDDGQMAYGIKPPCYYDEYENM